MVPLHTLTQFVRQKVLTSIHFDTRVPFGVCLMIIVLLIVKPYPTVYKLNLSIFIDWGKKNVKTDL